MKKLGGQVLLANERVREEKALDFKYRKRRRPRPRRRPTSPSLLLPDPPPLTPEQQAAIDELISHIR